MTRQDRWKFTTISEHPYVVSIELFDSPMCVGLILAPRHILTAAHCVPKNQELFEYLRVRSGSSVPSIDGETFKVSRAFVYEKFDANKFLYLPHEVAVLRLDEPISFDENQWMIHMFNKSQEAPLGSIAQVVGWGFNSKVHRRTMRSVNLTIVSKETCYLVYRGTNGLAKGELCADYLGEDLSSVCLGDLGEPLVVKGRLAGMVTKREACGYPRKYTEIAPFRKWIEEKMKIWS